MKTAGEREEGDQRDPERRAERTPECGQNGRDAEDYLEKKKQILIELMKDPVYKPMKLKELAILLNVPKERREELREILSGLAAEGLVSVSLRGKYGKPSLFSETGVFTGNSRGFGFVTVEGREQDIFIPAEKVGAAMSGDTVRISVEREQTKDRRAEGRVLNVVTHANSELVGLYQKKKNFGFVIPDNQRITKDIFIPQGKDLGAETGQKVMVKLSSYGNGKESPEGCVSEIIGHSSDPGVDILSLVRAYGLSEQFPEEVTALLPKVPNHVTKKLSEGRLDLREEQMVTIDGEDAKDLDDAVSLSYDDETGLYKLGVHIADVAEYVKEGSPLDREALLRGTSVYFPDRVLPMLPRELSNGICSLNQGEDRLALSCIMWIDCRGHVADHRIAESLIRVSRRLSYTNVDAIITKNDARRKEQFREFVPMLLLMKELSEILRKRRYRRGGIDFDFPESKITLDRKGQVLKVEAYERNAAHLLIEDFMLAANETVAENFYWQQIPFIYRTHEAPAPDKMRELSIFVENFGVFMKRQQDDTVHPKQVQELLRKTAGAPEEALIARLALRSMKQARYTTECSGHFGLAARFYTHFTSPIRRYPDLQIHRIIKEHLRGELSEQRLRHYESKLPEVAEASSVRERRAEEAERECDKMKKCEYMRRFVGEELEGVISGVTAFGFYVELPNTCEGLVHVNSLNDDYYVFNENSLELLGERNRRRFCLGMPVRIVVEHADKVMRTIDFRFAGFPEEPEQTAGKDKGNGKRHR